MFGRKKREAERELKVALEAAKREQAELQKTQAEQTEAFGELKRMLAAQNEQLDILLKDNSRQLKRYSEAIEDMLDEGKAQEALSRQYEQRIKEDTEREKSLLSLVCCYQEELSLIEKKLCAADTQSGNEWAGQMALFRKTLAPELKQCAIEETGLNGETVNYKYHEILDTVDTEDMGLDSTVACTYRPGLIYHGKVIKKAQVAAYRGRR
ncbi:MAG TPA: hypothetical protein DCZ23_06595 [Lachnospiraceae bacterium]|nr:hypothetical protein [Lachnospiraceae bacterium]